MNDQLNQNKLSFKLAAAAVIAVVFIFSMIFFIAGNNKYRRVFIFPSVEDGKYVVEYRYLNKKPVQGDVQFYIDELLLGPQIERTKLIFTRGTEVLSCFVRGNVLYLNLSADLLSGGDEATSIKNGFELLERNVCRNFSKIQKIEFFVDGKYAFE